MTGLSCFDNSQSTSAGARDPQTAHTCMYMNRHLKVASIDRQFDHIKKLCITLPIT